MVPVRTWACPATSNRSCSRTSGCRHPISHSEPPCSTRPSGFASAKRCATCDSSMIANARMYAINDVTAAAWRRLFEWIAREADVALDVIAHAPPLSLADLWLRDDLGCALIGG